MAVYAASKAFVLSFSEALWGECRARNVRARTLGRSLRRGQRLVSEPHVEPRVSRGEFL
jgi:hypothetical protein